MVKNQPKQLEHNMGISKKIYDTTPYMNLKIRANSKRISFNTTKNLLLPRTAKIPS